MGWEQVEKASCPTPPGLCVSVASRVLATPCCPTPSSPGDTAVPNENPAQWVFLPPDCDWGAHFQVPKGIKVGNAPCLGPSSHVATVWTLRREKHRPTVKELSQYLGEERMGSKFNWATGRNSATVSSWYLAGT